MSHYSLQWKLAYVTKTHIYVWDQSTWIKYSFFGDERIQLCWICISLWSLSSEHSGILLLYTVKHSWDAHTIFYQFEAKMSLFSKSNMHAGRMHGVLFTFIYIGGCGWGHTYPNNLTNIPTHLQRAYVQLIVWTLQYTVYMHPKKGGIKYLVEVIFLCFTTVM